MRVALRRAFLLGMLWVAGGNALLSADEALLEEIGRYPVPKVVVRGTAHPAVVGPVEIAPDGRSAVVCVKAAGAVYTSLRRIDLASAKETWSSDSLPESAERTIAGGGDALLSRGGACLLSRDGGRLLFRTHPTVNPEKFGGRLVLVDPTTGAVLGEQPASEGAADPVQQRLQAFFTRDGERFVALADGKPRLIVGSARGGAVSSRVELSGKRPVLSGPNPISPDGKTLLMFDERGFRPIDLASGKANGPPLSALLGGKPGAARGEQFVDDGSVLAVVSDSQVVRIDPKSWKPTSAALASKLSNLDLVRFSHDGRRLYVVQGRTRPMRFLAFDAVRGTKLADRPLPGGDFSTAQPPDGAGCAAVVDAPPTGDPTLSIHRLKLD